ncbi:MAG: hypothetical protein Q8Q03_01450 [bacterium]|nr:hypothetical protein [bacterium]
MKNLTYKIGLPVAMLILPIITFAQTRDLKYLIRIFTEYLTIAIYLIISLAVVTFVWNVYRYFFTEKDKKEAGMYVLYSTIGFFVILSLWGLVAILSNSLDLPTQQPVWPFGGQSSGQGYFPGPPGGTNSGALPSTGP